MIKRMIKQGRQLDTSVWVWDGGPAQNLVLYPHSRLLLDLAGVVGRPSVGIRLRQEGD
jgi:hypothetical protein